MYTYSCCTRRCDKLKRFKNKLVDKAQAIHRTNSLADTKKYVKKKQVDKAQALHRTNSLDDAGRRERGSARGGC
jgi:hypothetical protein